MITVLQQHKVFGSPIELLPYSENVSIYGDDIYSEIFKIITRTVSSLRSNNKFHFNYTHYTHRSRGIYYAVLVSDDISNVPKRIAIK